ncbi:MAG: type II toxin-antitoxin system Phd/YefM family antitoxin [Magnetococcales bacterium]|nr:type II toxin-antitoxin system Phd/YefM family antitoxin [Magnetococcales bacterium]
MTSISSSEIPAGDFQARCPQLMDEVANAHDELIVTRRGRPMVKVIPEEETLIPDLFGFM